MMLSIVLALAVSAAGRPDQLPTPNDRFPRNTWSTAGWATLRWGMGFGDVLVALRDPNGPFKVPDTFRCDDVADNKGMSYGHYVYTAECWIVPESHQFDIVGIRPTLVLDFWKRRLSGATVFLDHDGGFDEHRRAYFTLFRVLVEKYGRKYDVYPKAYRFPDAQPPSSSSIAIYEWDRPEIEVKFTSALAPRDAPAPREAISTSSTAIRVRPRS